MFFWNSLASSVIQHMFTIWSLVFLPFLNQLVHLELLGLCTAEVLLEWFWALPCWHVKWAQLYSSLGILWHCPSLGLEWKLICTSPMATMAKFPDTWSDTLSQHHLLGFEIVQLEFHHLQYLWCFLKPTWLCMLGCLALGEWLHRHGYPGH